MNSNTLHTSALGRTFLMYRADMRTIAPTLLSLVGIIFLVSFLIERIPLIFNLNYLQWAAGHASEYDLSAQSFLAAMTGSLFGLWYVNHRSFRSSPMSFALTPARFGEKVAAMAAVVASIWLLTQATLIGCFLLEVATVPYITFAEHFEYNMYKWSIESLENLIAKEAFTHAVIALTLVGIFSTFAGYYCVARIRNFSLGLVTALLAPGFIAFIIPTFVSVQLITQLFEYEEIVALFENDQIPMAFVYTYEIYITLLAIGAGYLLYKRLRTLPN